MTLAAGWRQERLPGEHSSEAGCVVAQIARFSRPLMHLAHKNSESPQCPVRI
eukprot:COSAG04_NODE_24552_length_320_cov_0.705882_1_plen_51_part_01